MRLGLLLAVATVACTDPPREPLAWGVGVRSFELGLGTVPSAFAIEDTTQLELPTYDGSGQVVHPDVWAEPSRLVMAMTPYPFSDDQYENPSILVSADGNHWEEPAPGINPLVPPPPFDHNDDPDIHRDPATGEYRMLYLETLRPDAQNVILLRSMDLVQWSRQTAIAYDFTRGSDPFIVSPSAIVRGGRTYLFAVDTVAGIIVMESADGLLWDKATARNVALDLGAIAPWHLDVLATPSGYAMLISGYVEDFGRQDVFLATSPDLATWTLRPDPLLSHEDPSLDVTSLYRSTAILANERLVVWYSNKH